MPDETATQPTVKCVECGYLTLRQFQTRRLMEVEDEIREIGGIPHHPDIRQYPGQPLYDPPLICFRRAFTLHEEQKNEIGGNVSPAQRILHVINKERHCNKFKKWEQGFTPKQHAEMDMIERQQVRQDARDAAAREFQATQAALADKRHRETIDAAADREAKNQSAQWKRTLLSLLIGAVVTLVAVYFREWIADTKKPQIGQTQAAPALPK